MVDFFRFQKHLMDLILHYGLELTPFYNLNIKHLLLVLENRSCVTDRCRKLQIFEKISKVLVTLEFCVEDSSTSKTSFFANIILILEKKSTLEYVTKFFEHL